MLKGIYMKPISIFLVPLDMNLSEKVYLISPPSTPKNLKLQLMGGGFVLPARTALKWALTWLVGADCRKVEDPTRQSTVQWWRNQSPSCHGRNGVILAEK